MNRIKSCALLLCCVLGTAKATGLGELEVTSSYGAPFSATLRVNIDGLNLAPQVRVAGSEAYDRLTLDRPRIVDSISVGELQRDGAGWYATLEGDAPVKELVLDLVLLIEEPGSRQARHYPVLLDFGPSPATSTAESTGRQAPRSIAASPRSSRSPSRDGDGTYRVRRGDTLFGIARSLGGQGSMAELAEAIFQANPEAFIRGDRNRLRADVDLRIPGSADVARPGETAPARVDPTPSEITVERVELTVPPEVAQLERSLDQLAASEDSELEARAEEARLQLAFSRAELETYRQENVALNEQIDILEQRLDDMQELLDLRDEDVAAALERESRSSAPAEMEPQPGLVTPEAATVPPRDPLPEPPAPSNEFDSKSVILYFGGGVVAIIGMVILFFYLREDKARAEQRRRLARQIEEESRLTLPEDL